ncbi:hypothetical protein VHEMI01709 [[Torrubiella] hemipterigena]|uniref:Concanavalin A-like lectin/glucanase n=1 Tax=[Torrubiella] hemipterigena TaxID=1531966 RepID=A0A0A1T8B5_9HYPO|nr:hypothetical protein VHEMI01709 [[Torrubiella] hemipterigena]
MKYALALSSIISAVVAVPAMLEHEAPMQSRPMDAVAKHGDNSYTQVSNNWSGIVQKGTGLNHITGTFTVPSVTGPDGSGASFWVGIDGTNGCNSLMQAGITADAGGSTYAWYEWYSEPAYNYNLAVKAGDVVRVTVDATSTTTGTTTTENLTTGKKASHKFTSGPGPLCEQNAEWVVEAYSRNGKTITLANYDTVTFSKAVASGSSGTYDGSTGESYELHQNSKTVSKCSGSSGDIVCKYQ